MSLWKLYVIFLKIGSLMIGGGYSMLPLLLRELVEKHKLVTEDDILNYFAVAQCTPGVIAVNTATFVGHRVRKLAGAIVATLGVITVPCLLILLISMVLMNFMDIPIVAHIFAGVRLAACALIASAVWKLFRKTVTDLKSILLFLGAFLFVAVGDISPIFVVLGAAIVGLAWGGMKRC